MSSVVLRPGPSLPPFPGSFAAQLPAPYRVSAARAEFLKYVGLVCMLFDHFSKFLGWSCFLSHPLGRMTFPLFAAAASVQICRPGVPVRVFRRLLVCSVLVLPVFYFVCREPILPAIFTLGAGGLLWAFLASAPDFRSLRPLLVLFGLLVLSCFGEYSVFGAVYVAGLALVLRRPGSSLGWSFFLVGVLGQFWTEGAWQLVACLGAPLLLFVAPPVPRVRRLFLSVYLLQWPIFAAVALA